MQSFMCFVIVFAMSSAIDVTLYDYFTKALTNDNMAAPKPVSCFSFGYYLNDTLYMRLYIRNQPPGVTAVTVIYQSGVETDERPMVVAQDTGYNYYLVRDVLNYTEVKISLKLYESHNTSSIIVAEGRDVMTPPNKITEEIYTYNDICFQPVPCVLLVNLEHGYNGPQIPPMTVDETTTPIIHLKDNNNNAVTIVSPSAHEDTKTSTSSSTSNTGTPSINKNKNNASIEKSVTDSEGLSNSSYKTTDPTSRLHENKEQTTNDTSTAGINQNKNNASTEKSVTDSESLSYSSCETTVPTSRLHENKEQRTNDTKSPDQQPSAPNVFTYVITSIIVMGVIILMTIYLCIKKYYHRNSQPAAAIELNTYATANEVVYAELSLMHEDSHATRHEEESPYAKIIGELRPADGKRKINES